MGSDGTDLVGFWAPVADTAARLGFESKILFHSCTAALRSVRLPCSSCEILLVTLQRQRLEALEMYY